MHFIEQLVEVEIAGEVSRRRFELDKRVFSVGKDLRSTGASALEVLNSLPSVTVKVYGEISLRGERRVQILIDGKPSILTDGQGNAGHHHSGHDRKHRGDHQPFRQARGHELFGQDAVGVLVKFIH